MAFERNYVAYHLPYIANTLVALAKLLSVFGNYVSNSPFCFIWTDISYYEIPLHFSTALGELMDGPKIEHRIPFFIFGKAAALFLILHISM